MVRYTHQARASGETTVNQYRLLDEAGRGTYTAVRWAEADGRRFAVKTFSRHVMDRNLVPRFGKDGVTMVPEMERVTQELQILGDCSHPNVLSLEEVIDDPEHHSLYVVLEGLQGGQLMDWSTRCSAYCIGYNPDAVQRHWGGQVRGGRFEAVMREADVVVYQEAVSKYLFRQLLEATAYLHERGVIHKDLKPDNVLMTLPTPVADSRFARVLSLDGWPAVSAPRATDGSQPSDATTSPCSEAEGGAVLRQLMAQAGFLAKLGDFNTAVVRELPDCLIHDAEGTQQFTPPECFKDHNDGLKGRPRDAWSLGCILFTMLFGRCPFWAEANIQLQLAIMEGTLVVPEGIVSREAEEMLRGLIRKDAVARLSAADALGQAWLQ